MNNDNSFPLFFLLIGNIVLDKSRSILNKTEDMPKDFGYLRKQNSFLFEYILNLCKKICHSSPNYIPILLEYELKRNIKNHPSLTDEELEIMILFNHLYQASVHHEDIYSVFEEIYHNIQNRVHFSDDVSIKLQKMINGYYDWEKIFVPAFLPEGFSELSHFSDKRTFEYKNLQDGYLIYKQRPHSVFLELSEFIEYETTAFKKELLWENQTGYIKKENHILECYWTISCENHLYSFYLKGNHVPYDQFVKVAKSVKIVI